MPRILDIITRKDKRRYDYLEGLIAQKKYDEFLSEDDGWNFGFSDLKYKDMILSRMESEAKDDIEFLLQMNRTNYNRRSHFNEIVLSEEPKKIESIIESSSDQFASTERYSIVQIAVDHGYLPSQEFIEKNIYSFNSASIMSKLIDNGYRPNSEMIESYEFRNIFADEELLNKVLDLGYVPSIDFINKKDLLQNQNLADRILDTIELTPENVSKLTLLGNVNAQRKIIEKNPSALLNASNSPSTPIWIEAIKKGYIPNEILSDYNFTGDFTLFSRIIKQRPELIKFCGILDEKDKDRLDELALSMGYVPTISDLRQSKYLQGRPEIIESLIKRRPEAIKYVQSDIIPDTFSDLARYAIDNGYIPTIKDLENNPKLANSFDIMKVLIQEDPNLITSIGENMPRKEEMLKLAIARGFNGSLLPLERKENNYSQYSEKLTDTETAIIYELEHRNHDLKYYTNNSDKTLSCNYSTTLYNFLKNNGYKTEDFISLFTGNFDVMKEIIKSNPEYINSIDNSSLREGNISTREKVDELCLLAIENGYEPKVEDEIFGYGSEVAKEMVSKYPEYIEKVQLMDRVGLFSGQPSDIYDEVCKIAVESGFVPDVEQMGTGVGYLSTKYNYSYDIMKKAIPLKLDLIEGCKVEDKEQFDELCKFALESGYDIKNTSIYALTHWATRLCTNYDMMAQYVEEHPEFLSHVEISNSDEMLKVIDIATENGFDISKLNQDELLKLFINVDESEWERYMDKDVAESLRKAKELQINNSEVSKTVKAKFLSEEITKHFTKEQIEILSCYPELQDKIIKMSKDDVRSSLIYELVDKYKENLEWVPILEKSLDNVFGKEYENLIENIKGKELSEEEKDNLLLLLMTDNHLDIASIEDLRNIDSIREEYISTLIERNTLGSLKTAYFEKVFGIDLLTAGNLVKTYGRSLESDSIVESLDEESRAEFELLQNMKKVLNLDNIDVLKMYIETIEPGFKVKPDLMVTYEAKLKYLFTKEFNKSFTKPKEEDRVTTGKEEEENLDIYLAAGHDGKKKCRMMITSLGAYTNMPEPDDYYACWNENKIASHGCCCSYVGEKNLGTARVKYCCLGFTDYENGSLQLSAPYDLSSASREDSHQIASYYPSMYLLPDDMLDETRHTHNETVWERRNISHDADFKKQPAYIVYFVDNFEDRLTNPEAMEQWESVKRAAENFGTELEGGEKKPLPIMVVEREKIAQSQLETIKGKLNEFKENLDPRLIKDIVVGYEDNYAGNREYHPNICEKYFPQQDNLSESVVGEVLKTIEEAYKTNPEIADKCLVELQKVVLKEQEKYTRIKHGLDESTPSFNIEESLIHINEVRSNYREKSDSVLCTVVMACDENDRQYRKNDESSIDEVTRGVQLSSQDVISILSESNLDDKVRQVEKEIKEEKVNNKLKVHGQRHVQNVLLYTALIGEATLEDKHDVDLLLLAAKYHDSGRKTDAHEEHAESSAKIAKEKLRGKCSEEDLAIISTIIEFHEVPRESTYSDETFKKIAKENGLPEDKLPKVREMAEVLKDADALDRTRFINRARLSPNFLHFGISKQLVKFAATMQETYAIQDLKEYQCDEAIETLSKEQTPQEILRTIRHSTRGKQEKGAVQDFITTWADSSKKVSSNPNPNANNQDQREEDL